MARHLQTYVRRLDLETGSYELYDGQAVAAPTTTPNGEGPAWRVHEIGSDRADEGWLAWATLPSDAEGGYVVDADAGGERTIRTPTIEASRARAWQAIELHAVEPAGTSVRYRLWDGAAAWWWTGAAWSTPGAGEWNTAAELAAHVATFPATTRTLAVIARLSSTRSTATPMFYGADVAYGCAVVGDLDDALIRTLQQSIRDELTATTEARVKLGEATDTVELVTEQQYTLTGVAAAYNLTDDPYEAAPLSGTFTAGDPAVLVLAGAQDEGDVLLLELEYSPDVVVRRHREIEQVAALPAIRIYPTTDDEQLGGQGEQLVRDLEASPPTALALRAPHLLRVSLEVRVIAALGNDAERLVRALRTGWLRSGGRVLVSPDTGRVISVAEVTPFRAVVGSLAMGVVEHRATWALTCELANADTADDAVLVRAGGVAVSTEDRT